MTRLTLVLLAVCAALAQAKTVDFDGVNMTYCEGDGCSNLTQNVFCGSDLDGSQPCNFESCTHNCHTSSGGSSMPKCTFNCSATSQWQCWPECEKNCMAYAGDIYVPKCKENCPSPSQQVSTCTFQAGSSVWLHDNLWWIITVPVVLFLLCCGCGIAGCMGFIKCCGLFKEQHHRRQEGKIAKQQEV